MTQDNPLPPPANEPTPVPPPAPGTTVPENAYVAPAPGAGDAAFAPPGAYAGPAPTPDDTTLAMVTHLLGIVSGFIGSLVVWLIKKDQNPFVGDQAKEALNFQITLAVVYVVGVVTLCIKIGILIILAVLVCNIVFSILAALEAKKGVAYRYPFAVRLIK